MITLPSSRSPAVQFIGIILFIATSIGFYGCNDVSNAPPPPEGPGALTVSSNALPTGFIGVAYPNLQLAGAGGTPPYTWSESASSPGLPPGLALNSSGVISGIPTQTGAFSPTFRLVDSAKPPAAVEKILPVTVSQVPQPTINTPSLPNGVQNRNYSATLTAAGGTQPYTNWSVTPALPPGLTFTSAGATATITGTPTGITNTTHTFRVTDSFSPTPQTGSTQLTLTVTAAPLPLSISTGSPLQDGTVNQSYGPITLSATGGTPTLVWDLASGSLPPGLQLSQGGILSGTPTAPSSVTPVFRVRDGGSPQQTATKPLAISISLPAPLTITTTSLSDGQLGQSYNQTVQASGGSGARNWSFQGGNIPNLSINPSTGVISGNPNSTGTFTFKVQVTDALFKDDKDFTIKVNPPPPPTITTSSLPIGTVSFPYTPTTLTATGGAAPLKFQPIGLPFGLMFDAATGTISGSPTSNGTQNVTFTVQDSTVPFNQTGSKTLTLTVNAALTIDTASLPGGIISRPYGPVTLSASGGAGPSTYIWSATGLPAGISVSQGGIISGTPSAVGQYPVTFRVQDSNNIVVTKTLTIAVSAVVITTPSPLPPGKELFLYTALNPLVTMSASGGTPGYTWSASGLPTGLTMSSSGQITGIPALGTSAASPYSVSITVTDSANISPSPQTFSLTITP